MHCYSQSGNEQKEGDRPIGNTLRFTIRIYSPDPSYSMVVTLSGSPSGKYVTLHADTGSDVTPPPAPPPPCGPLAAPRGASQASTTLCDVTSSTCTPRGMPGGCASVRLTTRVTSPCLFFAMHLYSPKIARCCCCEEEVMLICEKKHVV